MGISDAGDHYLVGAFTGDGDDLARLCVFDAAKTRCFEELALAKPNVGAILRQDDGAEHFYYAKEPGYGGEKGFHFVERINGAPVFHDELRFVISEDLYERSVLDVVALREPTGDDGGSLTIVDDGVDGGAYVVGLGQRFELLIVRLADDGYPEDFAVLESDVDWGDEPARDDKSAYGAAFLYVTAGLPDVLFASNEGWGIFRLKLPVAVPDDCWNTGFDAAAQSVCAGARAALERTSNSAEATSNDGMNCPFGYYDTPAPSAEPSAQPSGSPRPSAKPSAAPTPATKRCSKLKRIGECDASAKCEWIAGSHKCLEVCSRYDGNSKKCSKKKHCRYKNKQGACKTKRGCEYRKTKRKCKKDAGCRVRKGAKKFDAEGQKKRLCVDRRKKKKRQNKRALLRGANARARAPAYHD
mmetsp:Transcript_8118/g.27775  ORF Transcript_8118/g.27775 Transcript_8118/m.27775 type:complete len:413 (+) Transcript_8118:125-1363(+)